MKQKILSIRVSHYCQNLVKNYKCTEIESSPGFFNGTTKTVINQKSDLQKAFQEILNRIKRWLNWMDLVRLLKRFILSTLTFQPLNIYQGVITLYYLLN